MTPASVKRDYVMMLRERITVRRYTGSGNSRPRFDAEDIRARVTGYDRQELINNTNIIQGDSKVIVFADDLIDRGFALPVTVDDMIVVRGRELSIKAVDDKTRRVDGVLIAYDLQVEG